MRKIPLKFILIAAGAAIIIGGGYVAYRLSPRPVACTMEAKPCPDGSYVGRIGPNCEFASCPAPSLNCTSDAQCPSSAYTCEAIEGYATITPNGGTSSYTIMKGVCRLKAGGRCTSGSECQSGLVCFNGACTNPVGRPCQGADDKSCPVGYTCIQSCGPPVVREGEPPPPWYCEVNEVAKKPRMCPICLASDDRISTADGPVAAKDVRIGMRVWSRGARGSKVLARVKDVSRTPAPGAEVVDLALEDGREVLASPGHPTTDGRTVGLLHPGDAYDGSKVRSAALVPYHDGATYDLLPDSATGIYWANGIPLGSTLKR